MPRALYMPADARCRQLQRLIEQNPGISIEELAVVAAIGGRAARAYVVRLTRERRIEVVLDEPACARGCRKWLYPPGASPAAKRAA